MTDRSVTFSASPECDACGNPMETVDVIVKSRGFRIGPWEFQLWTWGKDIVCIACADSHALEQERDAAIWNDGAQHGYNDARDEYERRRNGY